jgi:hypothetical protein
MIKNIIVTMLFITGFISAQKVWKQNSYNDFVNGKFSDAGANMYVSHNGRIQAINRWDVNNDGNVEILSVNSHPLVEMLDMSIYWGNGKDFSIKNHSYIPANGPMWVTPDDLNNDGHVDLVVTNYSNGTWTGMESFVYYGGLKKDHIKKEGEWAHYPFHKRILLESSNAQKAAVGDFNNDGYKDIVIAFSAGFWEYRDKSKVGTSPSRIYWGSADDFNSKNFSEIATAGATDVVTADFDNDGWMDLAFANGEGNSSYIYFGSSTGFIDEKLFELPTLNAQAVEAADINNDGLIDLIFANSDGDESFAYLNINGTFNANNRIEFETYTAKDIVVSDFNKDGYPDIFFTNHQHSFTGDPNLANRLIHSYLYFGSANGFSKDNRQSIPTIGAWGANAADLNNDGWIDLLVCNFQEHYSFEVPSFVYWNSPEGFNETLRTPLYEHGAQGNAIADFNNDGYLDILITSMMGNSRGDYDPSYLFLGKDDGSMDVENKIILSSREGYEQAFADLNDDGYVDIIIQNRGETTRAANEAWIYWNNENQFNSWNISGLPSYNGLGVQVADLDKNGFLDIIISNGSPLLKKEKSWPGSFIYWGSESGWNVKDRTELPTKLTRACAIADINYDGNLDLIFGDQSGGSAIIFYGDGKRNYDIKNSWQFPKSQGSGNPEAADLNKDGLLDIVFAHDKNVLVYYQKKDFKYGDPISIPIQAKTMTVADVNNDGWLDLICPFYKGKSNRTWYSSVLLGSKEGFHINNSIKFPTDGGTGSLVCDFNRDGYMDVFFYCHRADGSYDEVGKYGDHHTNSLLYWGGPDGFSVDNVQKIPSVGAHYDMGVDIGNITDRKNIYSYISSPYNDKSSKPSVINWIAEVPNHTSIKFQLRSANSEKDLIKAKWLGPEGEASYYTEPGQSIKNINGKWIQYQAVFDMGNGAGSPVLTEVEIKFDK